MGAVVVAGLMGSLVTLGALLAALAGLVAGLALVVVSVASLGRRAWIPMAIVAGLVRVSGIVPRVRAFGWAQPPPMTGEHVGLPVRDSES